MILALIGLIIYLVVIIYAVLSRNIHHDFSNIHVIDNDLSLEKRINATQEKNIFLRKIVPGFQYNYKFSQVIQQVN